MVANLFDELHRNHRLTSVVVTHNLEFAKRCDRILKLEQGFLGSVDSRGEPVPGHGTVGKVHLAGLQREETDRTAASQEGGTEYV